MGGGGGDRLSEGLVKIHNISPPPTHPSCAVPLARHTPGMKYASGSAFGETPVRSRSSACRQSVTTMSDGAPGGFLRRAF